MTLILSRPRRGLFLPRFGLAPMETITKNCVELKPLVLLLLQRLVLLLLQRQKLRKWGEGVVVLVLLSMIVVGCTVDVELVLVTQTILVICFGDWRS